MCTTLVCVLCRCTHLAPLTSDACAGKSSSVAQYCKEGEMQAGQMRSDLRHRRGESKRTAAWPPAGHAASPQRARRAASPSGSYRRPRWPPHPGCCCADAGPLATAPAAAAGATVLAAVLPLPCKRRRVLGHGKPPPLASLAALASLVAAAAAGGSLWQRAAAGRPGWGAAPMRSLAEDWRCA